MLLAEIVQELRIFNFIASIIYLLLRNVYSRYWESELSSVMKDITSIHYLHINFLNLEDYVHDIFQPVGFIRALFFDSRIYVVVIKVPIKVLLNHSLDLRSIKYADVTKRRFSAISAQVVYRVYERLERVFNILSINRVVLYISESSFFLVENKVSYIKKERTYSDSSCEMIRELMDCLAQGRYIRSYSVRRE